LEAPLSIHREGYPFIALFAAVNLLAFLFAAWAGWLLLPITIWCIAFFRDPERKAPEGAGLIICPADGKLLPIVEAVPPVELGMGDAPRPRLSIFMNVFNVHVNRYPVSGTVQYVQATPGKFMNAIAENASLENEQTSVGIEAGSNRILVRQIAGLIARRIHTYSKVGDQAKKGDRMGMIRFGSRVDVFLPLDATLRVKVGDISYAGVTVLAELKGK
jgi:phosphatidylserine decarboxylase